MEGWKIRLAEERDALAQRGQGLSEFLEREDSLDKVGSMEQWELMEMQLAAMRVYLGVLNLRVKLVEAEECQQRQQPATS